MRERETSKDDDDSKKLSYVENTTTTRVILLLIIVIAFTFAKRSAEYESTSVKYWSSFSSIIRKRHKTQNTS